MEQSVKLFLAQDYPNREGNPMKAAKYRITDADGKDHEGKLDGDGRARLDGIKPGTCGVTFPEFDEEAWERI